jgi:hypothetical protein
VKLTTYLLVLRSRKCRSMYPLLHTPSRLSVELVKDRTYLTFYLFILGCYVNLDDIVVGLDKLKIHEVSVGLYT